MGVLNTWNSSLQKAMAHPTKRKIIECLMDADLSFTELLNMVGPINHGKFGYHLRALKGFVELEPSTKRYRLTDKGRILAGLIRDFSLAASMNEEYARYVENFVFGDHAFALYASEDFKRQISLPFLKAGLVRGEAVVYLVAEDKLDSEVRNIQRSGVDFNKLRKGAFTVMSAYEWYVDKGKAQAKTLVTNALQFLKEKEKSGFAGLRGAGEVEVFFDYAKSQEMFRYEELLGRHFTVNVCALCLYNVDRLEEGQFVRVYRAHGHIIQKGVVGRTVV